MGLLRSSYSSCFCLMSRPWITRFSSRSARGRRMMGVQEGEVSQSVPRPSGHYHPPVLDSQRDHLAHRPHGNDVGSASSGGNCNSFLHPATACLPQRNSELSTHMRCRMTASLRATATRARAMPRRFATCMPQARSEDHFVLRISSEWAAS